MERSQHSPADLGDLLGTLRLRVFHLPKRCPKLICAAVEPAPPFYSLSTGLPIIVFPYLDSDFIL